MNVTHVPLSTVAWWWSGVWTPFVWSIPAGSNGIRWGLIVFCGVKCFFSFIKRSYGKCTVDLADFCGSKIPASLLLVSIFLMRIPLPCCLWTVCWRRVWAKYETVERAFSFGDKLNRKMKGNERQCKFFFSYPSSFYSCYNSYGTKAE